MIRWNSFLRNLFLGALFCLVTGAVAQDGKTKVVLYKDRLAAQFDTVNCVKNVVKLNPLLFFRGEIPIYFERAISPRLSLEVGVGVTLRNYLALSFAGDDADDFGQGTTIVPQPSFHIGMRYYLGDDIEPQGPYIQPNFSHLRFIKDIQEKGPSGAFIDAFNRDDRTYNDVRVYLGYQMLSGNNNMMFDVYGGLGFRDRLNIKVKEDVAFMSDGSRQFTYAIEKTKDQTVAFFLGIRVGVGF